jgi:hypothetical protein
MDSSCIMVVRVVLGDKFDPVCVAIAVSVFRQLHAPSPNTQGSWPTNSSQQTGLHINCRQGVGTGIPWGLAEVSFQADDQPAREVLKTLIRLEQANSQSSKGRHPTFDHWALGCDGTGAPWCFIEVEKTDRLYRNRN